VIEPASFDTGDATVDIAADTHRNLKRRWFAASSPAWLRVDLAAVHHAN